MRQRSATVWTAVRRALVDQRDEMLVLLGVWCVTYGLWPLVGRPALIVPGAVMLWLGLPMRRRFVEPTERAPKSARRVA